MVKTNYNNLKDKFIDHKVAIAEVKKEASKILPWVHIAISNPKRLLLEIHHSIGNDLYTKLSQSILLQIQ